MNQIAYIPLDEINCAAARAMARRNELGSIERLANNIFSQGMKKNIVVRDEGQGRFVVVGGMQELAAIEFLAQKGRLERDVAIQCDVIRKDVDIAEVHA